MAKDTAAQEKPREEVTTMIREARFHGQLRTDTRVQNPFNKPPAHSPQAEPVNGSEVKPVMVGSPQKGYTACYTVAQYNALSDQLLAARQELAQVKSERDEELDPRDDETCRRICSLLFEQQITVRKALEALNEVMEGTMPILPEEDPTERERDELRTQLATLRKDTLEEAARFCEEEEILIGIDTLSQQSKIEHGAYIARELATRLRKMVSLDKD